MRHAWQNGQKAKGNILIRKEEVVEGEAHGGSWKVAYADFVTAMMAFFLLMWLLNATTEEQRKGLADYFSPNSVLSHNSSGIGQPFGGRTAFSEGAMLSDLGSPQVTIGQSACGRSRRGRRIGRHCPAAAASRRREEQGGGSGRQAAAEAATATGAERRSGRADVPVAATTAGAAAMFSASRPRPNCRRRWKSARNRPSNRRRSRFATRWATIRNWQSWHASW